MFIKKLTPPHTQESKPAQKLTRLPVSLGIRNEEQKRNKKLLKNLNFYKVCAALNMHSSS
jgi:hypothetical protein